MKQVLLSFTHPVTCTKVLVCLDWTEKTLWRLSNNRLNHHAIATSETQSSLPTRAFYLSHLSGHSANAISTSHSSCTVLSQSHYTPIHQVLAMARSPSHIHTSPYPSLTYPSTDLLSCLMSNPSPIPQTNPSISTPLQSAVKCQSRLKRESARSVNLLQAWGLDGVVARRCRAWFVSEHAKAGRREGVGKLNPDVQGAGCGC